MDSDISDRFAFTVGGVEFVTGFTERAVDAFTIVKAPELLARYERLLSRFDRPNVLEVGMAFGGSMAWLNEVARPRRLVGMDIRAEPIARLDDYIAERGADDVVALYGVDQADRATVGSLVHKHFDGERLDLVVDDASHLYGPSVALFETVFPLVRPGGVYLVEDWKWESNWARVISDEVERGATLPVDEMPEPQVPLTKLALDLVLVRAETLGVIEEVRVDSSWVEVVRGDAELDPETFRLDTVVRDHHSLLNAPPGGVGA